MNLKHVFCLKIYSSFQWLYRRRLSSIGGKHVCKIALFRKIATIIPYCNFDWVPNFEPCFRSLLSFLASDGRLRAVRRCGRHTEKERSRFVATETRRHSAVSHTSVERSVTKLRLSRSHLCSLTRLSQNHHSTIGAVVMAAPIRRKS